MKEADIQLVVNNLIKSANITGIQDNGAEDAEDNLPWNVASTNEMERILGPLPEKIRIIQTNLTG
jgi:hypothetical protein